MAQWHFNRHRPGDVHRDATATEFFNDQSISEPAEPLVREGIQNSLDARATDSPVKVRIMLSGQSGGAASAKDIAGFFDERYWKHVGGPHNGLNRPPKPGDSCPYLVFEDFRTKGLDGAPDETSLRSGKNKFFYFFRAEGLSDKELGERGRWGLGKNVFPICSRTKTWFGLTMRRSDSRTLLMGRMILRPRSLDGSDFSPDGFFGNVPETQDGAVQPLDMHQDADRVLVERFRDTFRLARQSSEFGTSIVVPWYRDDLTRQSLEQAVIRHYFWPILQSRLIVEVAEGNSPPICISGEYIKDWVDTNRTPELIRDRETARLAIWALENPDIQTDLPGGVPVGAPKWDSIDQSQPEWLSLRKRYSESMPLRIRVPIVVREKAEDGSRLPEVDSHFDVLVSRIRNDASLKPVFVRNDLVIPEVKVGQLRSITSLVIAQDSPIADLLGCAENPAHTEWQKNARQDDGRTFKERFLHAPACLEFIEKAPAALAKLLVEEDHEEDPSLLLDFFSLPPEDDEPSDDGPDDKETKKPGEASRLPPTLPPAKPRPIRIDRTEGGFAIVRGSPDAELPEALRIVAAYVVRRGDPFAKFTAAAKSGALDFDFRKRPIEMKLSGLEKVECTPNLIRVRVLDDDFRLEATGFDLKRDLKIKVTQEEASHDR